MKSKSKKQLILIELNEINFDYVKKYLAAQPNLLPNFKKLFTKFDEKKTYSEKEYDLLEPWIQWVSAHTDLEYKDHKVFRLGDIINHKHKQIFETVEEKGYEVGCVSPMNTKNNLKKPAYFIPDPWTDTESSDGFWSKNVHRLIRQTVNDNSSQKITFSSIIIIILALLRFAKFSNYFLYIKLALTSLGKPWRKALFLDLLVNDIHIGLLKSGKPNFSTVFLNAGAHIQHHYFHNSPFSSDKANNPDWYIKKHFDPFFEMLKVYDSIIGQYLNQDNEVIISTGLSQRPYNEIKYYYRLKDHHKFIEKLGIKFKEIFPRMTRDFLITFNNNDEMNSAIDILSQIKCKKTGLRLFEEIDTRDSSLFITLTYPFEITKDTDFISNVSMNLHNDVVFVAIKNGEHHDEGKIYLKEEKFPRKVDGNIHIKELYNIVNSYF